jgi:ABC-2 type transport system ATP-binding protein
MTDVMIEAKSLTKYYGDFLAIENVSFQVKKGEIVGFLGPNGSGKTTTMRILTGYMPPSSGSATIAGHDVLTQSLEARRQIGYLPETVPLYTDMPVADYLAYMGKLRDMDKANIRRRIDEVIATVRIEEYRDTLIGKLSKGYRQRVGLAQAILHEPQVLILDEPTIGIDPIQVVETRQLIRDLGKEHTLLLSTHILAEVGIVCQRVLIIHEGQLVAEDTPANLAQRLQATDQVEAEIRGPVQEVATALRAIPNVTNVRFSGAGDQRTFTVDSRPGGGIAEQVAQVVVNHRWGLLRLAPTTMSLEEIFLRLTAGGQEN